MPVPSQPEQGSSAALQELAAQLALVSQATVPDSHDHSRLHHNAQRILPWLISIAIHGSLAIAAVLVTWTVANLPQKDESVLIVADFNAMQYQPVVSTAPSDETDAPVSDVPNFSPPAPDAHELLNSAGQGSRDTAALLAELGGARTGESGATALAGLAQGSAGTHSVSFAGTSASNARRIVYIIDATGSMIGALQIVIDELGRSLSNLSSEQSFSVIFFQGNTAIEAPPAGRFIPATARELDRVIKWIHTSIVPRDRTNPLPAIEKAVRLNPDVIFLLSHGLTGHGEFEIDQRDLLDRLDKLNPVDRDLRRRRTQINCIQFMDPDPLDTMKLISQQHGGPNGYKFLSRKELGVGGP